MTNELTVLTLMAASTGVLHTLTGPDHYVPFIAMGRARQWSIVKTSWITFFCGIGHVLSSVVIGSIGIITGIGVQRLEIFEGQRGSIAAWLLIVFGFIYFLYGIYRAMKKYPHTHLHKHAGVAHTHEHTHHEGHNHVHKQNITPWVLFTIFLFGPCEVLIPQFMYPAANLSIAGTVLVTSVFAIATIGTMLTIVLISLFGINTIKLGKYEKYTHVIAGATIFLSGVAMELLGW